MGTCKYVQFSTGQAGMQLKMSVSGNKSPVPGEVQLPLLTAIKQMLVTVSQVLKAY